MKIVLPIKPLSVNAAFQGRRFKTPACRKYDKELDVRLLQFRNGAIKAEWYYVIYNFYLKNFSMTDGDNLVKVLSDALVRNGFISDDRRIKKFVVQKFKGNEDSIMIDILPYTEAI